MKIELKEILIKDVLTVCDFIKQEIDIYVIVVILLCEL